jgi:hypothetical protein
MARFGLTRGDKGLPHWPPYYPAGMNIYFDQQNMVKRDQVIFSDQPWAVAWYCDRMAIWLPKKTKGFDEMETVATNLKTPVVGILITPSSHGTRSIAEITRQFGDFTSLIIDGRGYQSTMPQGVTLFDKDPKLTAISNKYRYRASIIGMDMVYYSNQPLRVSE